MGHYVKTAEILFVVLVGCAPAAPVVVEASAGERGPPGPRGEAGPAGICDEGGCIAAAAEAVATRPVVLVGRGGLSITANAVYCGMTSETTGFVFEGQYTGYQVAKARCQIACRSATAHLCSADEVVRSAQIERILGVTGWYAAGVDDCWGFTANLQTAIGRTMSSGQVVGTSPCSNLWPLFCCD